MRKRILCTVLAVMMCLCFAAGADAEENTIEEPENLYAQSAVLMDTDSGRILFAKNGQDERPMASTTKIMTCILALENRKPEDKVTVSAKAASQPEVRLGMREGQQFYLKDLLYSLMLESHNDSAVAIAEHIGGSVEGFADMMNDKARELGCTDTYFITPNGLDAADETGIHHTTAADLAAVMKYCIMDSPQTEAFLQITGTKEYQFKDCEGQGSYHCANHNAFLNMMEGAFSGKTGFTADAGYCYVGALSDGERTFIVALLACGWPNNKGYKWSDTRKLMNYGLENYAYRDVWENLPDTNIPVEDGVTDNSAPGDSLEVTALTEEREYRVLLRSDEEVEVAFSLPEKIKAPVRTGDVLGKAVYSLNGETLAEYEIVAKNSIEERSFAWSAAYVLKTYFLNENRTVD